MRRGNIVFFKTLLLVGVVSLSVACSAGSSSEGDARARTVERTVAMSPGGVVEIANVVGLINVQGWDRAEVQVVARLGRDVERLDVLQEADRTRVRVVLPRRGNIKGSSDLTVRVPRDASVEVNAVSADVTVSETTGRQVLKTVSGNVQTQIEAADADITAVSGDVRLRGAGLATNVQVNSVSGDLLLENFAGLVDAVSVSGDVTVNMANATDIRIRSTSGDVALQAALARDTRVEVTTVSGDIRADTPSPVGFMADIQTFSGDIGGCLDVAVERTSKYAPGQRLRVRHGEGQATLRLKSMSGDIDICDR